MLDPNILTADYIEKIHMLICDPDASVMASILPLITILLQSSSALIQHFNITSSIVCILRQIQENKLKRSFNFFTIPAPWIQVYWFIFLQAHVLLELDRFG